MSTVTCPHCGKTRIVTTKIPRDVVVVFPCPECHELVVLFRGKVVGLKRDILQNGTKEERRNHIAEIVEEFLPPELFSGDMDLDAWQGGPSFPFAGQPPRGRWKRQQEEGEEEGNGPITDEEAERFYRFELQRIDETQYFKRHFG
ncbi:MAG: hypothetical protein U9Q79_12165 [Candidatus Hydrogenedentes bacterium]|nr:hypothetical protein [Candidatus Hydrogenedentota bacterium]